MKSVAQGRKLDLLHIDIQGAELDVVERSREFLRSNVAYMMIGTHSRRIEGRLMEALLDDGWVLEIERPAQLSVRSGSPIVSVDGVQGWRNTLLTAS